MSTDIATIDAKVDDLDRRIIALLQPEGRKPFAEIGLQLGVSEATVRQRYKKLTDGGVLQVVAVADPFRIGFTTMAMIGVSVSIEGERNVDGVARQIAQFPEVSYVVMSTGSFDLLVEVIAQSHEEFAKFLTERLHQVEGVRRTETFMLLRLYKMALGGWRAARVTEGPRPTSRVSIQHLQGEIDATGN